MVRRRGAARETKKRGRAERRPLPQGDRSKGVGEGRDVGERGVGIGAARDIEEGNISIDVRFIDLPLPGHTKWPTRACVTCHLAKWSRASRGYLSACLSV